MTLKNCTAHSLCAGPQLHFDLQVSVGKTKDREGQKPVCEGVMTDCGNPIKLSKPFATVTRRSQTWPDFLADRGRILGAPRCGRRAVAAG